MRSRQQIDLWLNFVVAAYFSNTEFSISERMGEAIHTLTGDQDQDVRAFFNPNQPPSTSEFYDSDGEPIGDVSVSIQYSFNSPPYYSKYYYFNWSQCWFDVQQDDWL